MQKNGPHNSPITLGKPYTFLYHKWYFDELYDRLFVNPSLKLGKFLWEEGDQEAIDGLGPNGLAALSVAGGGLSVVFKQGIFTITLLPWSSDWF